MNNRDILYNHCKKYIYYRDTDCGVSMLLPKMQMQLHIGPENATSFLMLWQRLG